ncbi:BLUF domain-containing protein [Hymenobacter sp. BT491]|nr:BLUF domain-containing protein [Hymenobacter sp. BT491]MBC6989989.1 BLUF domain-containing protein [Hymenobacter sp. BT491]
MFYQLIYVSVAFAPFTNPELHALAAQARAHNSQRHITGILFYGEGYFAQVLEGAQEEVESLYASIKRDTRHHHVTLVVRGTRPRREFPHWSMACRQLTYPAFAQLVKCLPETAHEVKTATGSHSLGARIAPYVEQGVRL